MTLLCDHVSYHQQHPLLTWFDCFLVWHRIVLGVTASPRSVWFQLCVRQFKCHALLHTISIHTLYKNRSCRLQSVSASGCIDSYQRCSKWVTDLLARSYKPTAVMRYQVGVMHTEKSALVDESPRWQIWRFYERCNDIMKDIMATMNRRKDLEKMGGEVKSLINSSREGNTTSTSLQLNPAHFSHFCFVIHAMYSS